MEKRNRRLLAFAIVAAGFAFLAFAPLTSEDPRFEEGMRRLKEEVKIGDDIYDARGKILGDFHSVSEVSDPTGMGEKLWMHVSFGISPSALETFAYSADISLPARGRRSSATVVASPQGIVTEIETH